MFLVKPAHALLAAFLFVSTTASSHHNTGAAFDLDQEITIAGEVTRYEYKNPHIYFYVRDADDTEWRVEAGPLALMNRFGWSSTTLKAGDNISMIGNPSRRAGRPSAFLKSASVAGVPLPATRGEDAFNTLLDDSPGGDEGANSLAGTWVTVLHPENSPWVDDAKLLPLTEKGLDAIEAFDEKTMSPALECIPVTAPSMMVIPDTKLIQLQEDVILISSEFNGATRTIHLGDSEPSNESIQGKSVGSLQGNQLTIQTTGFAQHRMGNAFMLPSGENKLLREWLILEDDGKSLTYRFEVDDPEYLSESFTSEVQWVYRPDVEFEALPCDLENSRLFIDE